ncbi:MAG: carboxypeptidase regulatory-like domain-containing protein [Planctomycetes bacterium]|nr:carboxypeptidase regulatory-like domain-containing protein [Planctomycetota bacterium]
MNRPTLIALAMVEAVLIAMLAVALLRGDDAPPIDAAPANQAIDTTSAAAPSPERTPSPVLPPLVEAAGTAPGSSRNAASIEGAAVFGRVTSARGIRLSSGGVALRRSDLAGASAPLRLPIRSGPTDYAFPGLALGRYELSVSSLGHRPATREIEITEDLASLRVDITLAPTWDLRVLMVTPDGVPLQEALRKQRDAQPGLFWPIVDALATLAPLSSPIPNVTERMPQFGLGQWNGGREQIFDNRPRLPKRYAGTIELPVDVPVYVSAVLRSAVLATERVEAGQEEVRLVIAVDDVRRSFGRVRVRLIDGASGAPAKGARVSLVDSQSGSSGVQVDGEGRVELSAPPGVLQLEVLAADSALPPWSIELSPGQFVDLGDLPLGIPREVAIRIEGIPAGERAGFSYKSREAPPHPALKAHYEYASVDQAGLAKPKLVAGRYTLLATAGRTMATLDFDTRALGDAPLVVALQPGAVLRIVPPPLERAVSLTITDERGVIAWRRAINWTQPTDVTLRPGRYDAAILRPDGAIEHRTLELGLAGAEIDLR